MRKQNSKQISANSAKRFRIWLKCETFVLLQLFVVASVVYCAAIIVCVMRYWCMSCFGYGWVGDIIAIVWVNVRGRLPAQMQHDFCDAFVCVFSIIVCSLGLCVLVSVRRVVHVQNHCTFCIRQLNSCLNVSVNIVLYPCGYAICMPARKPLLLLLRLARHRRKIANRDSNVMNNSRIKNIMYTCMPNPIWNETAATQSKIKKNRANPMLWQTHAQSFGSET